MNVAYLVYPGMTALDMVGPAEIISRWPGVQAQLVGAEPGPLRTDLGMEITPDADFDSARMPDLLLIPGASDPMPVLADAATLDWVRRVAESATLLTSVCSGASVYAAAGLLKGRRATTHWAFRDAVRAMGVEVVPDRVVYDLPFVTGAGVSAGIDLAIELTTMIDGEELARQLQLWVEYDPQPAYDVGSPEKAGPELTARTLRAWVPAHLKRLAREMGAGHAAPEPEPAA